MNDQSNKEQELKECQGAKHWGDTSFGRGLGLFIAFVGLALLCRACNFN